MADNKTLVDQLINLIANETEPQANTNTRVAAALTALRDYFDENIQDPVVVMTENEYDALEIKDPDTYYLIIDGSLIASKSTSLIILKPNIAVLWAANPEVMTILFNNGLSINEDYMLKSEAALITDAQLGDIFKGSNIRTFNELKYFTGVTNLYNTFEGCSNLTTAPVIPASVTNMNSTFYGCRSLTTAPVIPSSVTNMNSTFYGCSSLTKAPVIPSRVTDLRYTFRDCSSLTKAPVIPSSVTNLSGTFTICSSLTKAPVIPASVTNMNSTFYGCRSLTTAPVIPSSVTDLGYTFYGCSSLTTAPDIPEGVTNLEYTFSGCSKIDGIYVINIVTPISYKNSLSNVQAIYVPDASVDAYKTASGWNQFKDKIFPMSDKPQN